MKKFFKNNSISNLMNHITPDMYTKQTIESLFRCLLETAIENRFNAVALIKLADPHEFQGLLNRLKYSELKVYTYLDIDCDKFTRIHIDDSTLENEEFLVMIGERFSTSLYWDESTAEVFGLCQGFCTLDPYDARQIAEHLQTIAYSEELNNDLNAIKHDRRRNETSTTIIRKLATSLDTRQRDLICANTELQELYDKTIQAEKLAAIGQLCSSIAHEIRNPLSSMDLYAKIISKNIEKLSMEIKDQSVSTALSSASASISGAIVGLEKILTDLINYSKPMVIEKTKQDLEAALSEVVNLIKPSFEEKGVWLSFEYQLGNNMLVSFDKIRLNQAVLNIVKNALEVSKSGDEVEVIVENVHNSNEVTIKVKDQGTGISHEDKEKIFTPYFSTKNTGTGLGLAEARKIMEAHKGSLTVISTDSKGTVFGLSLPLEHFR